MDDCLHEESYKGYTIKVYHDDVTGYHDSPRDWDNLGTMLCVKHRHYLLGDEQQDADDIKEFIKENENNIVWLPLYLYDHSGLRMNTGGFHCPWDSGQVGIVYVTKERIREEYSCKRISKATLKKVLNVLNGEVKNYDHYISGQIYGYIIEDEHGEDGDSCWGFYGDYEEYMLPECRSIIDHDIIHRSKEAASEAIQEIWEVQAKFDALGWIGAII